MASAFQPRSPISDLSLFAGRWDQIVAIVDAIAQTGLHVVLFGERGIGKTSLANIVGPLTMMADRGAACKQVPNQTDPAPGVCTSQMLAISHDFPWLKYRHCLLARLSLRSCHHDQISYLNRSGQTASHPHN